MKKLKIFLLLSILLCFGFILSSEVHAQGDGPKSFEVGDVLPITTRLRISWGFDSVGEIISGRDGYITTDSDNYFLVYGVDIEEGGSLNVNFEVNGINVLNNNEWISPYTGVSGNHNYIDIDTSGWSLEQRTVSDVDWAFEEYVFWEDVANTPKKFEIGDILPAGNIKISWDFTGKPIDVLHIFSILGDSEGDEGLNIEISSYGDSGSIIIIFINDNEFFVNEPGGTILTLTEPITIHTVEGYETYDYEPLDYYEYIDDALLWEVVSQDYTDGYEDGYADAGVSYELGREHAREIYGYFDPITDQWLSVSEYIALYGTDKMDQSDFYDNFDKYFIPAMIIVFGGAIVLTILKVFKGRE